MKKLYLMLLAVLLTATFSNLFGQNDTLLFQDFNTELIEDEDIQIFPDAPDSDDKWITWDEDMLPDANNRPQNWYWTLAFELPDSIPAEDSIFVFASSSWLQNFDTSNTNWLVTPLITVGDDQATLHWKSAPFQGPRYMDGYSVKILTGSSAYFDADEINTVFRAAEMTAITGDGASVDLANFEFGPGYVHADGFTLTDYFIEPDTADANPAHTGVLEPHSVSLAEYAGQSIYVAFHHDSADDNLISVDDILVLGNIVSSSTVEERDLRFVTYPNPVSNYLNVLFRTQEAADISLELFSQSGQKVDEIAIADGYVGEYNEQFDLRRLPAGSYTVVLTIDGQVFTKNVVRK